MPQRIATSLLLFCLIIGFSGYQISQVQAASELTTPSTSLCDITRDLKLGMVGNDVKELQKYLNNNGFPLAQNGIGSKGKETNNFVTLTKNALTKFQKDNKIPATIGVFDLATRDFLGCKKENKVVLEIKIPICSITRDLKLGMVGNDVKELQKYLNNNGFPLAQNGIGSKGKETNNFVTLTKNALTKFQKDNKIPATIGVFDLATRDFLGCGNKTEITPIISYILTYTAGAGGTISGDASQTVKTGGNGLSVRATPKSGYYFTKWSDGVTKNPRTDMNVTVNKTVTAHFSYRYFGGGGGGGSSPSITTYIVTFDANGSTGGTVPTNQTKTHDITLALATNSGTLVKTGYTFAGWNTSADGSGTTYAVGANYTANAGVTLFAKWIVGSQTLTFESNGGSAVTAISQNFGTAIVAPTAPTKSGYTFGGWYNESELTNVHTFDTMGLSTTVYAKWTAIPFVCGDNVSFTYNDSPVIYGTVLNTTTGKCWLDRNLGATQVATSSTDSPSSGDLFQWGRPADGHQLVDRITTGSPVNGTQSPQITTITPGTSNFIIPSEDWSSSDSDGASRSAYFAKTDGTGICPTGFRVPTESEINAEILSWSSNNSTGAFTSPLKLPVTGGRVFSNGSLYDVWVNGYYWSTTVDTTSSRFLRFGGDTYLGNTHRAYGLAIRCIFEEMSDTYTVTFDTNGGDGGSTAPQTLNYNTPTTLTANGFTRNGYTFAGWATTAGGAVAYADQASYTIAAGNATLYAKWTIAVPTSLSYTPSNLFVINQAISTLSPTVTGTVDSYSISPDLPAGLSLNTSNGQITGTPTVSTNSTTYTITATNAGGFTTFDTLVMVDGTVTGADGRIWLDRNLGATRVATSFDDYQSYGSLFQWGRAADGHQLINHTTATAATAVNGNTSTLATSDTPGDSLFITNSSSPYDWRNPANNNLWQGVNGTNNVCPAGFRLPTQPEWSTLVSSAGITNSATAYSSSLKLTAAGYRGINDAALSNLGALGYYWSSGVFGNAAYELYFHSSGVDPANNVNRAFGFSVRCIQEVATAPSSITLAVGSSVPVGGVTNVAIPAAGATNTTGAVTGWVTSTADKIKFTVVNGGSASSTITIGGAAYTSGADYTIPSASPLTIIVTTTEAGRTPTTRTFTVSVAAAAVAPTVGMSYQGGKVAYILQAGDTGYVGGETHGLIASLADLSNGMYWHATNTGVTGATGTAIGTGLSNTNAIVATYGVETNAARLAYDYTNAETGTGVYSDWYLPSQNELNKLYINKVAIGGISNNFYWSSTEVNASLSYQQFLFSGGQETSNKNTSFYVRAVRSF